MSNIFGDPLIDHDVSTRSMLQIAYVGDAVWELIVRDQLFRKGLNVHHMHSESVQHVNAKAQASFVHLLLPMLTQQEIELIRRGRNAHARHPAPKNQNPEDYALATAFESLIGFLFLTGNDDRLNCIIDMIFGGNQHG